MTDLQKWKKFAEEMGLDFEVETVDPEKVDTYYKWEIKDRETRSRIRYQVYILCSYTLFDNNGRYIGSITGDEQPTWEERR